MRHDISVPIPAAGVICEGRLTGPDDPSAVVLFGDCEPAARRDPGRTAVADRLVEAGVATVRADLLTRREQAIDERTGRLRFDVGLLAGRLVTAVDWWASRQQRAPVPIGLFGDGAGAAVALVAAARRPAVVGAVVCRDGRPDRVGAASCAVRVPTLLMVHERDRCLVTLNQQAAAGLRVPCRLRLLPDTGDRARRAPELAAAWATAWFTEHLRSRVGAGQR
ncbi:dienelactone hydrolase family protein [Dactylosporangium aurantiacum]|uniref:Dienelactone hydrolase family protein n=1 Tax=Dactylosporangium aurantiacum TaxID=35754 RepID=A0A9Q9MKD7_9ACTN|nr:dienelactone hydrolase family protein [Dactylosporangium aurantiacum]MDG6110135.1 dienelactone hydrolase family protein [Dactylosporangium aurantiacum]UWZ57880.1 dienelactone hydrolase family protein [Dactylosporangium aurantiacum]